MENAVQYTRFRLLVGIATAFGWINIGWIIVGFAPLLPFISAEFGVPVGTVMIGVMAGNAVAGGTSALLCGPLIDRFGPRKVLFVSGILCVAYALLIPFFSGTLTQLVILRLLAGMVAHGPLFAGKAAMAQRWFPRKEQGTWIGIWNAAFAVGTGVMYQVYFPILKFSMALEDNPVSYLPHVTAEGAWRLVGAFSIVPSAIMAVMMGLSLFGKEPLPVRHGGNADAVKRDFSALLKLPVFWAGAILLGCAQGIMQSVNGLTASYLMRGLKWFPQIAGPSMVYIQGGMIVSGFLLGAILTYIFHGKTKWLAALGFLLAGLAAFALVSPFAIAGTMPMRVCFFCVGFLMNIGYPAVTTFIADNYPPHVLGKVFGICGGVSVYMGALFSGIAGALLNATHTYTSVYAFIFCVGIFGCIVSGVYLNPRARSQDGPPKGAAACVGVGAGATK